MKKKDNKNFIEKWKEEPLFLKILSIIGIIITIAIIILAFMQILNIWENDIFEPLLGILMIIQAIENWNINRKLSYYSLFVAIFIFIVTAIIIFL